MTERNTNPRVSRLKDQGHEFDLDGTTPAERIDMMWQLALDAWAFAGDANAEPRLSRHIDIWIRRSDANAAPVWRALQRFGAPVYDLTPIDLLTSIDDVDFDDAWQHRLTVDLVDLESLDRPSPDSA